MDLAVSYLAHRCWDYGHDWLAIWTFGDRSDDWLAITLFGSDGCDNVGWDWLALALHAHDGGGDDLWGSSWGRGRGWGWGWGSPNELNENGVALGGPVSVVEVEEVAAQALVEDC